MMRLLIKMDSMILVYNSFSNNIIIVENVEYLGIMVSIMIIIKFSKENS